MQIDPALIEALEPDQFSAAVRRPLPRRALSRSVLALLIILRLYVTLAIPLVGYAFIRALSAGPH